MKKLHLIGCTLGIFTLLANAQDMPQEYQNALTALGKKGDFKDNVLKINLPRNDLSITISNTPVPTPFGFGGWLALTKGDSGKDVMMGDLVLLQEEVNPVMSALLDNGLEVTALHNHFFWENPRIFYMHVHGCDAADNLMMKVKPAIDLMGKVSKSSASEPQMTQSAGTNLDQALLERVIGSKSDRMGSVIKFTIGRADIQLKEMGAVINARMGLNTWAAFTGSDDNATVAGDVAMLGNEVTPVLKTLRSHGLNVVAIHQHMVGTQPELIFLHYWGRGPAESLATGFKAALDQLGHTTGAPAMQADGKM